MNSRAVFGVVALAIVGPACGAGSPRGGSIRLISPLSTATVSSQRPTLHWAVGGDVDGAHVEICRDRACAVQVAAFDASGSSAAPPADLPPGNLFWRAFGRDGSATAQTATPTWEFTVGARSAPVDTSWGSALDVNGDGFADVVVGPRVYLGAVAPATTASMTLANLDSAGFDNGGFAGPAASAGDVNGDGYGDFVVRDNGVPSATVAGVVYLGSASGLPTAPSITLNGQVPNSETGSVAGAGDVNGDGYADIVVGNAEGGTGADTGAVYLYLGSATGTSPDPAATITGPAGLFGYSVAGAGDVNGDGYADVVVGDLGSTGDATSVPDAFAYVYLGGPNGLSAAPLVGLTKPDGTSLDSTTVASAGDVNGDGYADILVGDPAGETGAAYLYLGGPTGPSAIPSVTFAGLDSAFGAALMGVGDVDGDGYGDIVIGDPGRTPGGDLPGTPGNTGVAFVYLGSAMGPSTTASFTLVNPDSTGVTRPFQGAMGVGDVNGDGYADVASSVLGQNPLGYVFLGSGAGVASPPAITLD
jgi:FG-GAP-like repeat/FG-GAP repeat